MMEKETETVGVVRDKPASDSIQIVVKEEQVDQIQIHNNNLTVESKNESPVVVVEESVVAFENSEEFEDKGKYESSEKEPREMVLKECVEEVGAEAFDEEKAKKRETVEEVGEGIWVEKSVETAEKVDVKIVHVSADVKIQTTEVKVPQVESKPVASGGKESASEVEVKAEENSKTKEEAELEHQVKLEEKTFETKCPDEEVVLIISQMSEPKKESEEVANSLPIDFIEKISAEAKHIVEELSQDGEENKSEEIDVINKLGKEDEPLKQTDRESREREFSAKIQEEMITQKAADGLQTEPEINERGEAKQESEVTEKEVAVKPNHSNNIISKVKQSLVKAKKAIIGKSPSYFN